MFVPDIDLNGISTTESFLLNLSFSILPLEEITYALMLTEGELARVLIRKIAVTPLEKLEMLRCATGTEDDLLAPMIDKVKGACIVNKGSDGLPSFESKMIGLLNPLVYRSLIVEVLEDIAKKNGGLFLGEEFT